MRVRQHIEPRSRIAFMSEWRRRYRGELVNAARRAFTGPAEVIPLRARMRT